MAKIVDNVTFDISTLPIGSTATNHNLTIKMVGNPNYGLVKANIGRKSGKWYWETYCDNYKHTSVTAYGMGIMAKDEAIPQNTFSTANKTTAKILVGADPSTTNVARKDENATGARSIVNFGVNSNFTTGSVIGLLMDLDNGSLTVYKNGVKIEQVFSNLEIGREYVPIVPENMISNTTWYQTTTNFGATDFKFIPNDLPIGTKAYEGWLIKDYAVLQNTNNKKQYSLSDNTLIHLPDNTTEYIIEHGIEQGKFIQLDVPFDKHRYFNDTPVVNVNGKVFTHDIGMINTLSIKEFAKNKSFEPIYTWIETKMTSNNAPSPFVVSSSSNFNDTYQAWKAFNGTLTNLEDSWVTADGITNGWIQINYNIPKKLNFVRISPRNYIDFNSSSPKNFNILGSNNGVDFYLLAEVKGQNDWKQNTPKDFSFSNENNYNIYRLEVLDNNGSTGIAVGEILYGYKREVN